MDRDSLELDFTPEDRYSRFRLISWWDQELLGSSKVMVVGAGAIGNEVIKNLALLGVGTIYIVDMDRVENSNLSRSVLFSLKDEGKYKAEVAAGAAMEINPLIKAVPLVGNILGDVGMGLFKHVDLVIGGLDNREARVAINQKCWLTNTPWIDGAIEVLHGVARVFLPPEGPCYECTMTDLDYKLLNQRRSCALLARDDLLSGKVPTTPTTSAVIAGIQVQEAVKLLHRSPDLPVLAGKGFIFNGLTHDSYVVEYQLKEDCFAHETIENLETLTETKIEETTLQQLLSLIRRHLGEKTVLELNHELVTELDCSQCGTKEPFYRILDKVKEKDARCPRCQLVRTPQLTHRLAGSESYLDRTLAQIGIPPWDIVAGRNGLKKMYFELAGDQPIIISALTLPGVET